MRQSSLAKFGIGSSKSKAKPSQEEEEKQNKKSPTSRSATPVKKPSSRVAAKPVAESNI